MNPVYVVTANIMSKMGGVWVSGRDQSDTLGRW